MLTWGKEYWPWFLIVVSLAFLIPETIALLTYVSTHTDNTLSNYAHVNLNVSSKMTKHTFAWWFSLIAWVMFFGVITAHIWFDWLSRRG